MSRIISGLIISIIVVTAALLVFGMTGKVRKNKELEQRVRKLPDLSFTTVNGVLFNSSEISSGPVLVVLFHPECEHCQYEISEIMKSGLPVSGTKIILISSAGRNTVKSFIEQFDVSAFPSVTTLIDTTLKFGRIFGNNTVPGNYLYNKDLDLIKAFNGEVKTETILRYFKDGE
jgi:thiol-disulfide isomerase/thioredoxin